MADQAEQSCPPNVFPHEPPGATIMADDRKVKGEQDRSRINLSENYEVRYWTQKFGVTAAELRDAIKKVGNSAEAVEKELAG